MKFSEHTIKTMGWIIAFVLSALLPGCGGGGGGGGGGGEGAGALSQMALRSTV